MHFVVNAKAWTDAAGAVAKVTERRTTIPILSNMLVEASGSTVTLRATDLDMELTVPVEANVEKPGAITIPARTAHDIARKYAGSAEIDFNLEKDAHFVVMKSGRSRFELQTLPKGDFPEFTATGFTHLWKMKAPELTELFEQVQFAISTEETRYYLNGVYLHTLYGSSPLKMRAVATDGHRLGRFERDAPDGADGMPGIIVPRKTVSEVLGLAGNADKESQVIIQLSDSKVRFEFGKTVLVSKLIDGTFPDYERVIPKGNNKIATIDAKTLVTAVDRVATVSSERGRAVKFDVGPGQVTLAVNNPDAGSATEQIDAAYDGPELTIGFNANYLKEAIAALGSGETRLELEDGGSPTLIKNDKAPGMLIVVMPMRV